MLFHNKYTISIGRLAVMLDSQNYALIKRIRIPLPERMIMKAYNKLMDEVNEALNKTALEREIETGILRLKLYNKAFVLYPALLKTAKLTWDAEHLKIIEEITGYKLEKLEDREILIAEIDRLQAKYRELVSEKKSEGGVSFSELIISTEIILDREISRDILLYEFANYTHKATEKLQAMEHLNDR